MCRILLAIALTCVSDGTTPAADRIVVSSTYENLAADRSFENVPVTFSRIGAEGDFIDGITPMINGKKLPAQVNVLRRAPDGSIRHALVSFLLPQFAADGDLKIGWLNEKPPEPPGFEWGFEQAKFDVKLMLTAEKGETLTSDVGKINDGNWAEKIRMPGITGQCSHDHVISLATDFDSASFPMVDGNDSVNIGKIGQ